MDSVGIVNAVECWYNRLSLLEQLLVVGVGRAFGWYWNSLRCCNSLRSLLERSLVFEQWTVLKQSSVLQQWSVLKQLSVLVQISVLRQSLVGIGTVVGAE